MNYIKCFSRSPVRAANNLQPVFFVPVPPCWHGWSITPVCHLRPSGASMLVRMGYYAPVPFAPVQVPPCWYGWSITPVCHLRPSRCLHAGTDGVLRPCAICARPGASMLARYTHYSISQILELFAVVTTPGSSL